MKKVTKENPLTHFRKANEARQKTVKASMKKMQEGGGIDPMTFDPYARYAGPLEKNNYDFLNYQYPSTNNKAKFSLMVDPKTVAKEAAGRAWAEDQMRQGPKLSESSVYKKGGSVKKMSKGGITKSKMTKGKKC